MENYDAAMTALYSAFKTQNVLYTNTGIAIGLGVALATIGLCFALKFLGEFIMTTGRVIQQRLLSFEEVRLLNARQMQKCINAAVGKGTISRQQGDEMLAQMAKRFSRWEFLPPKRQPISRPASMVKEEIISRLPPEVLAKKGQKKSVLSAIFAKIKPAT